MKEEILAGLSYWILSLVLWLSLIAILYFYHIKTLYILTAVFPLSLFHTVLAWSLDYLTRQANSRRPSHWRRIVLFLLIGLLMIVILISIAYWMKHR